MRKLALLVVVIVVALALVVAFVASSVGPPQVGRSRLTWQRGEESASEAGERQETGDVAVSARAGTLAANNSVSTMTSSVSSGDHRFAAESLMLFNLSDHPLAMRAAVELVDDLKQLPSLRRIEYFPPGEWPTEGSPAPDLFMTMRLESSEESGLMLKHQLKATFVATLGTSLLDLSRTHDGAYRPFGTLFESTIELNHESTFQGFDWSSAGLTQQAENIAESLSGAVKDRVGEMLDKSANAAPAPDGLFASWRPAPEFRFLADYKAERLTSLHGLMAHNETVWRIENAQDPAAIVKAIQDELEADGWSSSQTSATPGNLPSLKMTRGTQSIQVFTLGEDFRESRERQTDAPTNLAVSYSDGMTDDEIAAAMEEVFASESPDAQQMLAFRRLASAEQRKRLGELLVEHPPTTADGWVALAEYHLGENAADAARDALVRAQHLAYGMNDAGSVEKRIKTAAQKLKLPLDELKTPLPEVFAEVGFVRIPITPEEPTASTTIGAGETAKFSLHQDDPPKNKVITVTVESLGSEQTNAGYKVTIMRADINGSRMVNTSSGLHLGTPYQRNFRDEELQLTVQIEQRNNDTFEVRINSASEEEKTENSETQ